MNLSRPPPRHRQRGVALIVGMIMLIVITLAVVAELHARSQQPRDRREHAASQRGHGVGAARGRGGRGSNLLTTTPANIFQPPCSANNTKCYNVNKDSTNTTADQIMVTLTPTPTCVKAEVIKSANLNLASGNDQVCVVQARQQPASRMWWGADSLCANSTWEIRAEAADHVTQAKSAITQGVATRVRAVDIAASCP